MIAGVGGRLVSHAYVERQLLPSIMAARDPEDRAHERHFFQWWRRVERALGPASSARAVLDVGVTPLLTWLGHATSSMTTHGWGLSGVVDGTRTTLVVLPWSASLDSVWSDVLRAGLASGARWTLVTNGRALRFVDGARIWSRQVLECDLGALAADPHGARTLRAFAGADALGAGSPGSQTLADLVAESDRYAARVCHSLGDGVLTALPGLIGALASPPARRAATSDRPFEQALTIVYRVLFLLFAEARGLVPIGNDVYREGYTIDALRRRVMERPGARGLWASLQAISRMAHDGCRAGSLNVTAFNGRLFSPLHAPLVERCVVPDAVTEGVLLALATTASPNGRQPIAYHDLGVEQLGSVYERVLEYEPGRAQAAGTLTRTSIERKATGSFYTPRAMTEFVVRRTLHPLVEGKTASEILALRLVDPAMGSGAFLVAACRYLAGECEAALIRDGDWRANEVTSADRTGLRRAVAERCLYGVDLNPTAVQLARLSLWLTTLASDRPLTFLDHHLMAGNSLIGARVADLARPPSVPRRRQSGEPGPRLPFSEDEVAGVARTRVIPERMRLAIDPSDSLDAVRLKERTLAALVGFDGPFARWMAAADVWCAALLWPGAQPSPALIREGMAAALGGVTALPSTALEAWRREAAAVARSHAVFHWDLAFPEVFFDVHGQSPVHAGFDAVIGNPPWDMVRADTGSANNRETERARAVSQLRFCRSSGAYNHQGQGQSNQYQLFLERAWQLLKPDGRWGLILPSGIATDHGSATLRRALFDRATVDTWLGFDNRRAIFPIHRSMRFVVITATQEGSTERLDYQCGLQEAAVLDRRPSRPSEEVERDRLSIARSRLEAWDPDHLTIPEITSRDALGILTLAASSHPRLSSPDGWRARFGRELNATDDKAHFVTAAYRGASLPIVEGKHLQPFQVTLDSHMARIPRAAAERLIASRSSYGRARLAYRDVASATNRLTLIAGMLPRHTLSTHTVFCLKSEMPLRDQWCLMGLLNSLAANFLVRLHVTTHVTASLMARLPVPCPERESGARRELATLARTLARSGVDAAPGAYARLNAISAGLYGLSREQYAHVVESFPLLPTDLRSACNQAYKSATEARRRSSRWPSVKIAGTPPV